MNGKRVFYCEFAYAVGIVVLAVGTALMEKADFGMSMVVAPAYLLHLKVSQYLPFFSFGMAEYVFQAVLLGLLSLFMGRVKRGYVLSFVTAVIYGTVLDLAMAEAALLPLGGMAGRLVYYLAGLVICAVGVSFFFYTYLPPEAYELVVKELSEKLRSSIGKTKTAYDCCSCALGIGLSLAFFGGFVGVKWGTVVCAAVNGGLIGRISGRLERTFTFKDGLPLRKILQ